MPRDDVNCSKMYAQDIDKIMSVMPRYLQKSAFTVIGGSLI
jgi:hypothetical protein